MLLILHGQTDISYINTIKCVLKLFLFLVKQGSEVSIGLQVQVIQFKRLKD